MTIEQIRDYENWIGRTAAEIKQEVLNFGGWQAVFPKTRSFPLWASRVRNYFNVEPKFMSRVLPKKNAHNLTDFYLDVIPKKYIGRYAWVRGVVYQDSKKNIWFQSDPAGTGYHYKGGNGDSNRSAMQKKFINGQERIPIFKLMSLDGTGGSMETIIHNPKMNTNDKYERLIKPRKSILVEQGRKLDVMKMVITIPKYQGSYNYLDTVRKGFTAHERVDIKPHRIHNNFYVDPPNRFSPLSTRRFKRHDKGGGEINRNKLFEFPRYLKK